MVNKTKQEINDKKRDNVIDIARGACSIFMILTHAETWWGKSQQFSKYTGVFFLVFFFFCSGLFFKEPENKCRYLLQKFCRLEIPYIIVCIMVLAKRYNSGIRHIPSLINSFFYALPAEFEPPFLLFGTKTIGIGPAWFLNCLYICLCIYIAIGICFRIIFHFKYVKNSENGRNSNYKMEVVFKTIVIVVLAIIASVSQKYCVLPLNIQDGLIGTMFFHFGVIAVPYVKKLIYWAKKDTTKASILFIIMIVIYYLDINYIPYQWLDLGSNKYNPESLIGTAIGFLLLILGSVLLEKVKYIGQLMSFIGLNSMIVLMIHAVDIDILRDWRQVSLLFIIATFAGYISATYVYVGVKKLCLQKGAANND